jgi:hypothetical protein
VWGAQITAQGRSKSRKVPSDSSHVESAAAVGSLKIGGLTLHKVADAWGFAEGIEHTGERRGYRRRTGKASTLEFLCRSNESE